MIENENYKLCLGDCLKIMKEIPDKSIDMILCDLPYGVTARNKWDIEIPLNDYIDVNGKSLYKDEFYLQQFMKGMDKKEIGVLKYEGGYE